MNPVLDRIDERTVERVGAAAAAIVVIVAFAVGAYAWNPAWRLPWESGPGYDPIGPPPTDVVLTPPP